MKRYLCTFFLFVSTALSGSTPSDDSLDPSPVINIAFPVDEHNWQPVYPSLPYGQNRIFLGPEGVIPNGVECIEITKYSKDSTLKSERIALEVLSGDTVYHEKYDETDVAYAYTEGNKRLFVAERYIERPDGLYRIRYDAPEDSLNDSQKLQWWDRVNLARIGQTPQNNSWIHLTAEGVKRDGKTLAPSTNWISRQHRSLPFTINLPASWDFNEALANFKNRDFTPCGYFWRADHLAHGEITVSQNGCRISSSELKENKELLVQILPTLINYLRQGKPGKVIEYGLFENNQGGQDVYIIAEQEGMISWCVLYSTKISNYLIEITVDKENFPHLREQIHQILYSFRANLKVDE